MIFYSPFVSTDTDSNGIRGSQASERQGIVGLQLLLSPYLAAGLPAAGAAAIAIYGSYGDQLRHLYNSIFRKFHVQSLYNGILVIVEIMVRYRNGILNLFSDPCEILNCVNTTNTCRNGKCYCGTSTSLVCDASSQYPFCSEGSCICSKEKKQYDIGDGTTQGSCTSSLHKCQSDGKCVECINDSECTGLSNKCANGACVCGGLSGPCNSTRSNICNFNGECMCGENPECYTTLQAIKIRYYGEEGCDQSKCSWEYLSETCTQQRGVEVCEKITKYYNPLYLEGELDADSKPLDFTCDDEKGKYLGTYQCLGN